MPFTIYTHTGCGSYSLTPLLAIDHLWRAHHASASAMQTAFGQLGLQTLLAEQTLHLSPVPATKRLYACLSCNVLFHTSFLAQTHLHETHDDEVALTRVLSGNAGVANMLTSVWIADDKENNEAGTPDGTPEAAVQPEPQSQPPATTPFTLRLVIKNYSTRGHYPAQISLKVAVPRTTRSIAALAQIIEAAFVDVGGPADRIGWVDMIACVGIHVAGGVLHTDAKVAAWVREAAAQEEGHMDGDGDAV